MCEKELIKSHVAKSFDEFPGNQITEEQSIAPDVAGLVLYDTPLIGFADAADPLFQEFKKQGIVGPWFMDPSEWLLEAKTVISLFFPFTEAVKKRNRRCTDSISAEWLHGRIEGQAYLNAFMQQLHEWFTSCGVGSCVPATDPRFHAFMGESAPTVDADNNTHIFGSNWSERHAAYVCGLGTFGLSKGLITEKGIAGRFASIIIDKQLEPDGRPYTEIYEYCTQCGACIRRCPVQAITFEHGKNHTICNEWLNNTKKRYAPRYGCGLCQTGVPCESRIPQKLTKRCE